MLCGHRFDTLIIFLVLCVYCIYRVYFKGLGEWEGGQSQETWLQVLNMLAFDDFPTVFTTNTDQTVFSAISSIFDTVTDRCQVL